MCCKRESKVKSIEVGWMVNRVYEEKLTESKEPATNEPYMCVSGMCHEGERVAN